MLSTFLQVTYRGISTCIHITTSIYSTTSMLLFIEWYTSIEVCKEYSAKYRSPDCISIPSSHYRYLFWTIRKWKISATLCGCSSITGYNATTIWPSRGPNDSKSTLHKLIWRCWFYNKTTITNEWTASMQKELTQWLQYLWMLDSAYDNRL